MICDKTKINKVNCSICDLHWTEECPNYHKYFCSKCGKEISEEEDAFNFGLCNNCDNEFIDHSYSNSVLEEVFNQGK